MEEPKELAKLSPNERREFRNKYDTFFFDMDGTLAKLSKEPIEGAVQTVAALAAAGKEMYVFTDTCLHTREDLGRSVLRNFPQLKKENMINPGWLLGKHLKEIGFKKKVYVVGEPEGIVKELKDAGLDVISDDEPVKLGTGDVLKIISRLEPALIGAVVIGADINFSYTKLLKAVHYLMDPSVLFFVSHLQVVALYDPVIPAAGAISLPIEKICQRRPTSFCKSGHSSVDYLRGLGLDMSKCLFVGDGPNDMLCGNRCGMDTLLVLTGMSDLDGLRRLAHDDGQSELIPTFVAPSIADLGSIYTSLPVDSAL